MTEDDRGPPPEGWAGFFAENGERMLRIAGRIVGQHARLGGGAEDVASEAMCRLLTKGIPKGADARAYALVTVKNVALDLVKKANRFPGDEIDLDDRIGVEDIEVAVDDALLAEEIRDALGELPEREARAVEEKVMKNRHWRDVAPELGVTTGQGVGKIVSRALGCLRKLPRFAELSTGVSTSPSPSAPTGRPPGATP